MTTPKPRRGPLILGALLVALGLVLLPGQHLVPVLAWLWPIGLMAGGLVLIGLVVWRGARPRFLFTGSLLLTGGLLLQALALWPEALALERSWPLFGLVGGLSVLAYALGVPAVERPPLLIPGLGLIVLTGLFLPFSFDLVTISFLSLAATWGPLVVLVFGLVVVGLHFAQGRRDKS